MPESAGITRPLIKSTPECDRRLTVEGSPTLVSSIKELEPQGELLTASSTPPRTRPESKVHFWLLSDLNLVFTDLTHKPPDPSSV
jgi:hypothetical protein